MTSSGCARADVGGCEEVEDGRLTDVLGDLTVAVSRRLHYVAARICPKMAPDCRSL